MWQNATVQTMESAFLNYLIAFVAGIAGGGAVSMGLRWRISRRCFQLECSVSDLQNMMATLRGKAGAEVRWGKQKSLEAEIKEMKPDAVPQGRRFANDSMGSDEIYGLSR
jgi:hypothetical protein